ncbi:hypothetical protein IWX50DRAFT_626821 [Phyllosticta citricarpa]
MRRWHLRFLCSSPQLTHGIFLQLSRTTDPRYFPGKHQSAHLNSTCSSNSWGKLCHSRIVHHIASPMETQNFD